MICNCGAGTYAEHSVDCDFHEPVYKRYGITHNEAIELLEMIGYQRLFRGKRLQVTVKILNEPIP